MIAAEQHAKQGKRDKEDSGQHGQQNALVEDHDGADGDAEDRADEIADAIRSGDITDAGDQRGDVVDDGDHTKYDKADADQLADGQQRGEEDQQKPQ